MLMHGIFIAIEGLDGSGGTTQTRLLVQWLAAQGMWTEVVSTCEPSPGPVGQFIRQALQRDSAARIGDGVLPYLFAADRRDHLDREIIPALQRRAAVVTDRYYHSSLAYQSLSVGLARVSRLNESFRRPDLTIYLDLPAEVCLERILARGEALERFEAIDRLRSIQAAYESVIIHCRTSGERIVRIDASGTVEALHHEVTRQVEAVLAELSA